MLPPTQLVHYASFDGKIISAFLAMPFNLKRDGSNPLIVLPHGGPTGQVQDSFSPRIIALVSRGYTVIAPNVRGSTGYGVAFEKANYQDLGGGDLQDEIYGVKFVEATGYVDPKKVGITGGSYGGFMTLAVATNYNQRICCSVDIVGISNLVTFLEHTSGYRQDLRRVEYGDERDPKMRAFLETISPLNKAKNITKPLFVIAGKNDPRVPEGESKQMVDTVRKNGTPVWYLLAKDEGHGFRKKKNRDYQFYATVMFVKEFLLK